MTTVSLLRKKISNGKLSLYLSYYPYIINPQTGKKTRREFIKQYIFENPKTKAEIKHNDETLRIADIILSKRKVQLFNREYGFEENVKHIIDFKVFFEKVLDKRYNEDRNYSSFRSSYLHFLNFRTSPISPLKLMLS